MVMHYKALSVARVLLEPSGERSDPRGRGDAYPSMLGLEVSVRKLINDEGLCRSPAPGRCLA
jgi:hypothetical protein